MANDVEKIYMTITSPDGKSEKVEVLISFEFDDTKKEYMIYTKNEIDVNGNKTVYVSSVTRRGEDISLGKIESEEDWTRIKEVLRELSRSAQ